MIDPKYLDLAAELAVKVDPHRVSPNPRVGCVIVHEGEVIATGVHSKFGEAHAEVLATNGLKTLRDCDVYVTMEPCEMFPGKKTPSCTDMLRSLKPARVITGMLDPRFQGESMETFRQAGIEAVFIDHAPSRALNPFFPKYIENLLPYVTVKIGQSLDGKTKFSDRRYITNDLSRQKVHEMRAEYSAILTTTKTVINDNPSLDVRTVGADFPRTLENSSSPDVIVVGQKPIPSSARIFSIPGREVHHFKTRDLEAIFSECKKRGIESILTECGMTMATELISKKLVDEIDVFIAPEILGEKAISAELSSLLPAEIDFRDFEVREIQNLNGDVFARWVKKK